MLGTSLDFSPSCRALQQLPGAGRAHGAVGSAWGSPPAQSSSRSSAAHRNNGKLSLPRSERCSEGGLCVSRRGRRQEQGAAAVLVCVPSDSPDLLILFPKLSYSAGQDHRGKITCLLTFSPSSAGRIWAVLQWCCWGTLSSCSKQSSDTVGKL